MDRIKNKTPWKEELQALKLDHLKNNNPGLLELVGRYTMKLSPYEDTTQNGLAKCLIDFITFQGGNATKNGMENILATIQGQRVIIEVKAGKDYMSLAQLQKIEQEDASGGLYFVARNMQTFVEWYKKAFNKKRVMVQLQVHKNSVKTA